MGGEESALPRRGLVGVVEADPQELRPPERERIELVRARHERRPQEDGVGRELGAARSAAPGREREELSSLSPEAPVEEVGEAEVARRRRDGVAGAGRRRRDRRHGLDRERLARVPCRGEAEEQDRVRVAGPCEPAREDLAEPLGRRGQPEPHVSQAERVDREGELVRVHGSPTPLEARADPVVAARAERRDVRERQVALPRGPRRDLAEHGRARDRRPPALDALGEGERLSSGGRGRDERIDRLRVPRDFGVGDRDRGRALVLDDEPQEDRLPGDEARARELELVDEHGLLLRYHPRCEQKETREDRRRKRRTQPPRSHARPPPLRSSCSWSRPCRAWCGPSREAAGCRARRSGAGSSGRSS